MSAVAQRSGVRIVTAPDAACDGPTWSQAVGMMRGRLAVRFGEAVAVEHVAVFSPRFFELPEVAAMVEGGAELPIVLVDDAEISRGGKLSEARIAEAIDAAGALGTGER